MLPRCIRLVPGVAVFLVVAANAAAQSGALQRARLLVTVADQSGAVIPNATVTVAGEDEGLRPRTIDPAQTSAAGLATFDALEPGRYTIQARFPGFETVVVRDVRLRPGETRRTVVLPIKKVAEDVVVGRDRQTRAIDPRGNAFSTVLTREQIAALPDDPDEMEAVLKAMAPPGATMRVDGFTGGKLPPKSQIRSIRLPRMDAFAAQNHGGMTAMLHIDVMTGPGSGPLRGSVDIALRDDALNARNPFTPEKGDESLKQGGGSISGTIVPNRSSFSFECPTRADVRLGQPARRPAGHHRRARGPAPGRASARQRPVRPGAEPGAPAPVLISAHRGGAQEPGRRRFRSSRSGVREPDV